MVRTDFVSVVFLIIERLWSGVFHILMALFNTCDFLLSYVTRFTCDIFGFLMCVPYYSNRLVLLSISLKQLIL
jgi:hypothetical protein